MSGTYSACRGGQVPGAAEYRLGVTWCILNDGALGSIRDIQQRRYAERYLGTGFEVQPDFAAIARACGCHGERVSDSERAEDAVANALNENERRRRAGRGRGPRARGGRRDRDRDGPVGARPPSRPR